MLNGIINSAGSLGYAVGPLLAGRAFDLTGKLRHLDKGGGGNRIAGDRAYDTG